MLILDKQKSDFFFIENSQRLKNRYGKAPLYTSLFLLAGFLVIVCQLAAIAIVAGSQVQKAELRSALHLAQFSSAEKCTKDFVISASVAQEKCASISSHSSMGQSADSAADAMKDESSFAVFASWFQSPVPLTASPSSTATVIR